MNVFYRDRKLTRDQFLVLSILERGMKVKYRYKGQRTFKGLKYILMTANGIPFLFGPGFKTNYECAIYDKETYPWSIMIQFEIEAWIEDTLKTLKQDY